jgi:hypothetical protein
MGVPVNIFSLVLKNILNLQNLYFLLPGIGLVVIIKDFRRSEINIKISAAFERYFILLYCKFSMTV